MKKVVLLLSLLLFTIAAFAQTTINSGDPALEMTVKRTFIRGNDACIDILVVGHNSWECISFWWIERQVYDDEGNFYEKDNVSFEVDGKTSSIIRIARDIPRKMRIVVHNIDDYASSFPLIKLTYDGNNTNANTRTMVIKGLPITRD